MEKNLRTALVWVCVVLSLTSATSFAAAPTVDLLTRTRQLDEKTQNMKKDIMELGRNLAYLAWVGGVRKDDHRSNIVISREMLSFGSTLAKLEDGLLAPPGIQLVVFVSVDAPSDFLLQHIDLQLGRQQIQSRPYTREELDTLNKKGTAHRLWIGNIPEGRHTLNVSMIGRQDREVYRDQGSLTFRKGADRKTVEIRISSMFGKPRVHFEEWD